MLRLCSGDLRLPLVRASSATRERMAKALAAIIAAEDAEIAGIAAARTPRLALVPPLASVPPRSFVH